MLLPLALALCVQASPCRLEIRYADRPDPTSEYVYLESGLPGDEAIYLSAYYPDRRTFYDCDPSRTPRRFSEVYGRWVRVCVVHRDTLAILGRMTPEDFALACSVEAFADEASPGRPRSYEDMLVTLGLGSGSVVTRETAQRILVSHGDRSIGALLRGLRSRDAEVRHRCTLILDEVANGWDGE